MIGEFLQSIGLSDKEVQMYLALQRYGTQATSQLAKKAGMNRGTAYVTLHALLEKGLISKIIRNRVQYFSPREPDHLLQYIHQKQQELERRRGEADTVLHQILALRHPQSARPSLEYFEGGEGARAALLKTLTAKSKTIVAFTSLKDLIEFVGTDFLDAYTKQRVRAGYSLKIIRTRKKYDQAVRKLSKGNRYETNAKEKREVRYISDDMTFPVSMYLFDDRIVILSSKKENFAVLMTSKETSGMQKKLFSLLWEHLSKP